MKVSKKLLKIFKALSNPHRLQLFLEIRKEHQRLAEEEAERNVCFLAPLAEALGIGAPTVSHHLKELVNAELVETEKEGKFVLCKPNEETLAEIKDVFGQFSTVLKEGDNL